MSKDVNPIGRRQRSLLQTSSEMRSITLLPLCLLSLALTASAAPALQKRWGADSLPPTGSTTLKPLSTSKGFLTAKDGQLYVSDSCWKFATFNSPHLLTSDELEVSTIQANRPSSVLMFLLRHSNLVKGRRHICHVVCIRPARNKDVYARRLFRQHR